MTIRFMKGAEIEDNNIKMCRNKEKQTHLIETAHTHTQAGLNTTHCNAGS